MDELPFADIVRRRMAETGTGLRELCRAAGLDPSFLSKVLAGKRNPPSEEGTLRRIAEALGFDAPRLIVSAGRVPREWRGLWTDEALFDSVNRILEGGLRQAAAFELKPIKRGERRAPLADKPFGEELL